MKNETVSMLRVAIYIRVSSDEQAETGDSIRDQRERCQKYIEDHANMTLQDVYIDDGVSGQKIDRDDFTRLMSNVKNGLIDLIVFTKLDRWFRSLRHYLNTQAVLEKYGAAWTAIDQPYFDTSTPYGRAFVAQSMTWAELEAQNGGIRVTDVFRSKVQHGEVITGKVPRGYRIEDKHLVLSEEASAVHDSILYFYKTQSLHKTVRYMQENYGIVMTLQNFKKSILRNEKITGRYRGNENYCPRLISDEVYQDIQRILDNNSNIRSSQKYNYIFSGLLVCDECGYKMSGCHINVVAHKKSGVTYRYHYPAYECKQYRAYHNCLNGGEIRELKIEEYLLSHIREELDAHLAEYELKDQLIIDNRGKKKKLVRKMELLKELYLNEAISLDEYKRDRADLEAQLASLPDIEKPSHDISSLRTVLGTDFETIYYNFDNMERRRFWRSILAEIRISKSTNRQREYRLVFL